MIHTLFLSEKQMEWETNVTEMTLLKNKTKQWRRQYCGKTYIHTVTGNNNRIQVVPATGYHKRSVSTTTNQLMSVVHPLTNVTTPDRGEKKKRKKKKKKKKKENIFKINIWVLFYAIVSRQEVNAAKLVWAPVTTCPIVAKSVKVWHHQPYNMQAESQPAKVHDSPSRVSQQVSALEVCILKKVAKKKENVRKMLLCGENYQFSSTLVHIQGWIWERERERWGRGRKKEVVVQK